MSVWGEAEINEAKQLVASDGGDTGAFLKDIAAENPGARTAQQDIGEIMQAGQKAWQATQGVLNAIENSGAVQEAGEFDRDVITPALQECGPLCM